MRKYCNNCKNKVVMHAFSFGNCEICGEEISTEHIPCNQICLKCAEENNLCESCGIKIETDEKKT